MSELKEIIKRNGLSNLKKGDKVLALHLGFPIEAEPFRKAKESCYVSYANKCR